MNEKASIIYSDVVIIGGGLSGVNMACQLQRQLGITDFVLYERARELGGAWAANRYPGCGVDIPGALYSLSWFPNTHFKKIFPSQTEVLAYIQRVARAYRVEQHTIFRTEWLGARWLEEKGIWHISLRNIDTGVDHFHRAKVLISAVGGYTNPKLPSLSGAEKFEGQIVHTAQWDKEYDLRGLNVAIIGNGCSASQVVPAIINDVGSLVQIIRQPQHYVPMPLLNTQYGHFFRFLLSWVPLLLVLVRWLIFWVLDSGRTQFLENAEGDAMRKKSLKKSREYITENAPARYWSLLTPKYDLGCRRRILDNKYIRSLHRKNMHLVQDAVVRVEPKSITMASGAQHPVEFIILATGFEFSQWKGNQIFGRNGISLQQHWAKSGGIEAYKSIALHDFPNYFYLLGPNSGSGHTSVLFAIECCVDSVITIVQPVLQLRSRMVEVVEKAEAQWCTDVQEALQQTVLTNSCSNQYADPRTRWNFFSYPFSSLNFWRDMRFPNMDHWSYK